MFTVTAMDITVKVEIFSASLVQNNILTQSKYE